MEGEDLVFVTPDDSAKGRNLRRVGRVALRVDGSDPPYTFVLIEGTTITTEDQEELLYWSTRSAARYVGEEKAEEYGRMNAGEGMMLVRVMPSHVVSENNITGE